MAVNSYRMKLDGKVVEIMGLPMLRALCHGCGLLFLISDAVKGYEECRNCGGEMVFDWCRENPVLIPKQPS